MINYSLQINNRKWCVSFYIMKSDGKRKQKQLSTGITALDNKGNRINKRKAEEKAKEIVARFDGIVDSEYSGWTLDKCVEYCLELRKTKLSPTTYFDYLNALKCHIKPYFQNRKSIRDLKAKDIEAFCSFMISEGKSPKTGRYTLNKAWP